MDIKKMQAKASTASNLLKLMSNPARLLILCQLTQGERCAGDLQDLTGLSQTALSQHLTRLRKEGLVDYRRDHRHLYYHLADERIDALMQTLHTLYCE